MYINYINIPLNLIFGVQRRPLARRCALDVTRGNVNVAWPGFHESSNLQELRYAHALDGSERAERAHLPSPAPRAGPHCRSGRAECCGEPTMLAAARCFAVGRAKPGAGRTAESARAAQVVEAAHGV
jgi:hypothetical protein